MTSAWTVDTLKEYFEALRADDQRAVQTALSAAEKRLDGMNEFRDTLRDQASTFMPRTEAEQRMTQNTEKIEAVAALASAGLSSVNSRLDQSQGQKQGISDSWGYLAGIIGLVGAVIGIILAVT